MAEPDKPEWIECVVCCEEINPAKTLRLPCKHCYHAQCMIDWAQQHAGQEITCPQCRAPLSKETLQELQKPLSYFDMILLPIMLLVMMFETIPGYVAMGWQRIRQLVLQIRTACSRIFVFFDVWARATLAVLASFLNELHTYMTIFGDAVLAKLRFSMHAAKRMWDRALTQATCCAEVLSSWVHTCRDAISFSVARALLHLAVASCCIHNAVAPACTRVCDTLQYARLRVFQALRSALSGCRQVAIEIAHYVAEIVTGWCGRGHAAVSALFLVVTRHVVTPFSRAAQEALCSTFSWGKWMLISIVHLIEVIFCWCKQAAYAPACAVFRMLRHTCPNICRITCLFKSWVGCVRSAATQATLAFVRTFLLHMQLAASTMWQAVIMTSAWVHRHAVTAGDYAELLWHSIHRPVCLVCRHVRGSLHDAGSEILSVGCQVTKEMERRSTEIITFCRTQVCDKVFAVFHDMMQTICGIMVPICRRMWQMLCVAAQATSRFCWPYIADLGTLVRSAMHAIFAWGHHIVIQTADQMSEVIFRWQRQACGAASAVVQIMFNGWQSLHYVVSLICVRSLTLAKQALLSFFREALAIVVSSYQYISAEGTWIRVALQSAARAIKKLGDFTIRALWFLAKGILEILRTIATTLYNIVYRPRCSVCKTGQAKLRSLCFTCVVDHLVPRCSQCARGWCKFQTRCLSCSIDHYFDNPRCCVCQRGFKKLGSHCVTCFLDRTFSRCDVCHRGFQKLGCRCFTCIADSLWSRCNVCSRGYCKIGTRCLTCSKDHVIESLRNPPCCAVCSRGHAKLGSLCFTCFADCFHKRCVVCQRGYRKFGGLCVTCYVDQFKSRCDMCHRGYAKIGKRCFTCCKQHYPRCGVCQRGYAKIGSRCFSCFKDHLTDFARCGVCNRGCAKIGTRCFTCYKEHYPRCGVCQRGYAKIGARCFGCFKHHLLNFPRCGVCQRGYAKIGTRCFGCFKQHLTNFPRCGVCQRGYAKVGTRCMTCFKEHVRARLR